MIDLERYVQRPYSPARLGSFGDASGMLIRDSKGFPRTYDPERAEIMSADHDRVRSWLGYTAFYECFRRYTGGTGDMGLPAWLHGVGSRRPSDKTVIAFLKELMRADGEWSDFRVLGTVNRANGYPVWTLQLYRRKARAAQQEQRE